MFEAFKTTLERKSLRWKVTIAFLAMSVIPTLAMLYLLADNVELSSVNIYQIVLVFALCLWLALAGHVMIRQIVEAIAGIARETKIIAEGQYDIRMLHHTDAELKDIAEAVNSMTDRMKEYISELKEYGNKSCELNAKIRKKVSTLTNLVKIGEMISSGEEFREVAMFSARSISEETEGGAAAIFVKDSAGRYSVEALSEGDEDASMVEGFYNKLSYVENLLKVHEYVLTDSHPLREPWQKETRRRLGDINAIFFPINSLSGSAGVVVAFKSGKDVIFATDELEAMSAIHNEIVLSYRSMEASEKIKSLEVLDKVTGVYSVNYMKERLDDEVARAVFYRRPCSLVIIDVDGTDRKISTLEKNEKERLLKELAALLAGICPTTGKLGMLGQLEFAMVLPEVNKRGSLEIGEKVRFEIASRAFYPWGKGILTASVGVGENPIDGSSADVITEKAREFILKARGSGGNRVVGE